MTLVWMVTGSGTWLTARLGWNVAGWLYRVRTGAAAGRREDRRSVAP
jgi:hypothetical protein